jgi:hypothetical protein
MNGRRARAFRRAAEALTIGMSPKVTRYVYRRIKSGKTPF